MKPRIFPQGHRLPLYLALALVLCLGGCVTLSSQLDGIDQTYKREFYEKVARAEASPNHMEDKELFTETLNRIDLFIRDYKDQARPADMAHVKIMQALVFLQKGEYDKARLAIKLADSYKTDEVRDKVLAESLPHIIWGWQASKSGRAGTLGKTKVEAIQKLDSCLAELDQKDYRVFFQSENREKGGGEIYLYLTAARSIFHHNRAFLIGDLGMAEYREAFRHDGAVQIKEDYRKAIQQLEEVLQQFLPPNEFEVLKQAGFADAAGTVDLTSSWLGAETRLARYKALYLFLREEEKRATP